MHITVRFPVLDVDGTLVALAIGNPEAEFGDEVILDAVAESKQLAPLYVAAVDTAPAREIANDVLELFGYTDSVAFVAALERAYGTGLPTRIPVTIYTLYDRPVEESAR